MPEETENHLQDINIILGLLVPRIVLHQTRTWLASVCWKGTVNVCVLPVSSNLPTTPGTHSIAV